MKAKDLEPLTVHPFGGRLVVLVPNGRGEELRVHLASHSIDSVLCRDSESPYERLEVPATEADPETLQAILDNWER
jgi:hypothetical protein